MGLDIMVRRITDRRKNSDGCMDVQDEVYGKMPEWALAKARRQTQTWYDYDRYKAETGIDIEEWQTCIEIGPHASIAHVRKPGQEEEIRINMDQVPTKKVARKVVYYKECGYQRKGLNHRFYEDSDSGKIGYLVWTLKELRRFKRDYCSTRADKADFQHNIIDNFVPGECCVAFDW